ncbi:MAG: hypothetical protein KGI80_03100 [Verrucomicrobiota bacterium]|nr:hypothetical protein [Verrucomicrobiota bacterium]
MNRTLLIAFTVTALALCAQNEGTRRSIWKGNSTLTSASVEEQSGPCMTEGGCPHHINIGGSYTYAWIQPHGNPTTKGSLGGAQFLYEYYPPNSVYAAVECRWRIGDTTNGPSSSRSLQDFNSQERLGYTFYCKDRDAKATLFSGLGARYLPETVKLRSASVDFNYTEFYVPIGCLLEKTFHSFFSWGLNFQWMPQIFPTVHISPLTGSQWNLTYQLNNFFVEMPFSLHTYSNRLLFIFSPFFELWHDGKSTAFARKIGSYDRIALGLRGNTYLFTGLYGTLGVLF